MAPPKSPTSHRFLTGNRLSRVPAPPATSPSGELAQTDSDQHKTGQHANDQFAPKPRFGKAKSLHRPIEQDVPEQREGHDFVHALRASVRLTDDVEDLQASKVEDASASLTADFQLDDYGESPSKLATDGSKRRRLDVEPPIRLSPPEPRFAVPRSLDSSVYPRPSFKPASASTVYSSSAIAPSQSFADLTPGRPSFVRPAVSQSPGHVFSPLPEVFSPTRKGQKFVPGGLAATVQQWVLQTGQEAIDVRRAVAADAAKSQSRFRVVAVESIDSTYGPCFVRVAQVEANAMSKEAHLMLVGSGSPRVRHHVVVGSLIIVNPPHWEVQAHGITWTVCVDWTGGAASDREA